jgi:hypothetical protein
MKRMYVVVLAGVLALCLTGGAVAATQITGNSIKNGSVTGQDLRNGSVTGKDIKNGSLGESELAQSVRRKLNTSVSGSPGQPGPKGEKGDRGPAGPAGPAGSDGSWFPAGFFVTNKSVGLTAHGADFGPYADGGATGGSVLYTGLNGKTLKDIKALTYTASYTTSDGNRLGVPYLRVFLNDDNDDVVLDPTECATTTPSEGEAHTWDMLASSELRYSDDACGANSTPLSWDAIVAAHGDDVISGIYVTAGFAGGKDQHVWLTDLTVNGKAFHFGA